MVHRLLEFMRQARRDMDLEPVTLPLQALQDQRQEAGYAGVHRAELQDPCRGALLQGCAHAFPMGDEVTSTVRQREAAGGEHGWPAAPVEDGDVQFLFEGAYLHADRGQRKPDGIPRFSKAAAVGDGNQRVERLYVHVRDLFLLQAQQPHGIAAHDLRRFSALIGNCSNHSLYPLTGQKGRSWHRACDRRGTSRQPSRTLPSQAFSRSTCPARGTCSADEMRHGGFQ